MDPAPRAYDDLPTDDGTGLTVPFACGTADAYGGSPDGATSAATLDKRRVTQCALSRVCGVCGAGLGRPIAFLGTGREVGRNAFHFPPGHLECASRLLEEYVAAGASLLDEPAADWQIVLTSGFEYVRPAKEQEDRRPVFSPNSVISHHPVG